MLKIKKIKNDKYIQGETGMCSLAAIVVSNITSDKEYAEAAYYCLFMINTAIHEADYELPHMAFTAKARNSAGVGLIGVAHWMAKNKLKYDSEEGQHALHKMAETHYWHLVNASIKMSEEYGIASWMYKTKWPEGWLPLDTYNKNIDTIADFKNERDWESIRKVIIDNGGIHNSVLVAHMPTESCLEKSTKVRLADGGLISLEDIFNTTGHDLQVAADAIDISSHNRWFDLPEPIMLETTYGPKPCNRIWLNGISNYIDLEMEDGTTIKLTHKHKLLVKDINGETTWKMAIDIQEGDDIVSVDE